MTATPTPKRSTSISPTSSWSAATSRSPRVIPPVTPAQRQAAAKTKDQADDKEHLDDIPDKPEGPFDSDQQTEVKTTLSRGPMFSEVR